MMFIFQAFIRWQNNSGQEEPQEISGPLTFIRINVCIVTAAFALKLPLCNENLGWGSTFYLGGIFV